MAYFYAAPNLTQRPVPPLDDESADSLIGELAGKTVNALSYIGGALDKAFGGRAIRGLLGGRPEELLSIIPFSDSLNITDPSNAVSGRELLQKSGLVERNRPGLDLGDVLGFGAEVAMDPATYLTFGAAALTRAGKAAQAAGKLPSRASGRLGTTLRGALQGATDMELAAARKTADDLGVTLDELLDQPLGGLGGWGLPFARTASTVFGTGEKSQKVADFMGATGDVIASMPGVRDIRPLFQRKLQRARTVEGQRVAEQYTADAADATLRAREMRANLAQQLFQAGAHEMPEVLRKVAEGVPLNEADVVELRKVIDNEELLSDRGVENLLPALSQIDPRLKALTDVAERGKAVLQQALEGQQNLGLSINEWVSKFETDYWPRQSTLSEVVHGFKRKPIDLAHRFMEGRQEIFDVPGGTGTLEEMLHDPHVTGFDRFGSSSSRTTRQVYTNNPQAAAHIREKYFGWNADKEADLLQLKQGLDAKAGMDIADLGRQQVEALAGQLGVDPAVIEIVQARWQAWQSIKQQSDHLADFFGSLPPEVRTGRFFGNHPLIDLERNLVAAGQAASAANATHNLFARTAQLVSDTAGQLGAQAFAMPQAGSLLEQWQRGGTSALVDQLSGRVVGGDRMIPIEEALDRVGLKFNNINEAEHVAKGAKVEALKRLQAEGVLAPGATLKDLQKVVVPERYVKDAERFMKPWVAPEEVSPFIKAWDGIVNLYKPMLTSAFRVNFHIRNYLTGAGWQAFIRDASDPRFARSDPRAWFQPHQDWQAVRKGEVLKDASQIAGLEHLDDAAATKALATEMYANRIVNAVTQATEVQGATKELGQRSAIEGIPGMQPLGFKEGLLGTGELGWKPWEIRGVLSDRDRFAPVVVGRNAAQAMENDMRASMYLAYRRQGYAPAQAAQMTREAHVDYMDLTHFERQVLRRVIPFYTFTRHMVPLTLRELTEHPGGVVAAAMKAQYQADQDAGFRPQYLGGTLGLPVWKNPDGSTRYLTTLGAPFEAGLESVRFGSGGLADTAMAVLGGQLAPPIKLPLELATGKQFFSGRELWELDRRLTPSIAVDQLIYNSPLSTVLTQAGTLADDRKGIGAKAINLLTGARVSDVDVERSRDSEARKVIEKALKGNPAIGVFENLYVKPDQGSQLTIDDIQKMQAYMALQQRAKEKARARQKELVQR